MTTIVVRKTEIIGTEITDYTAWEKCSIFGHTTISHDDAGVCWGRVGCRPLPEDLGKMPAGSDERIAAMRTWHEAQYAEAYAAIELAHPETSQGSRSMGTITLIGSSETGPRSTPEPAAPTAELVAPKAPSTGRFRKLSPAERARRPRLAARLERLEARLARLNKRRELSLDKTIDSAVTAADTRREIYALERRIEAIDTEQERAQSAAEDDEKLEDQTQIYTAGFRTLAAVGDVVLLRCNGSARLRVKRLNPKTVSTEGGSKWGYLDLAPLRAGDEIPVKEIMAAGRAAANRTATD